MDPTERNRHLLKETYIVDKCMVPPKIIAQDLKNGQGALVTQSG